MTREEIIRNLKYTMKKHKDDRVDTFSTNIELMCKDILDYLEQEPCTDAVSRQEVLKQLKGCLTGGDTEYKYVKLHIDSIPSVSPARPKGKWIEDVDNWGDVITTVNGYTCSECRAFNTDRDNFCPNCGADMRQAESEDKE